MCRLFGVIANKPVDIEFSLERADRPFKQLGERNPDGWGIGWYEDKVPKIYKEGISASESLKLSELARQVRSRIIISHVRRSTHGEPSKKNSHPFKLKNWIFAHNGIIDRQEALEFLSDEFRDSVQGETDSEVYFYLLLQKILECGDVLYGIQNAINEITESMDFSSLNFLLSDGENLYALRYANSLEPYTLHLLKRTPQNHPPYELVSSETGQMLRSKSLNNEMAVLVCSEELTDESWEMIENGTLVKIDRSLKVYIEKIV